jgi:hypothetical protein
MPIGAVHVRHPLCLFLTENKFICRGMVGCRGENSQTETSCLSRSSRIVALGRYELLTKSQSEMLGILFGDGSMSWNRSSVQISIAGHKLDDREYLMDRVRPMFSQLFDILLKVLLVKDQNAMLLYTYSKQVALTLHEWGMPLAERNCPSSRRMSHWMRYLSSEAYSTQMAVYIVSMDHTRKSSSSLLPFPYFRI